MERYKVKLVGTGAYLPGEPIEFDNILNVIGEIKGAPPNIAKWMDQVKPLMKEMLGIEKSFYAIDPVTRKFTETNVTMSVKAAKKAMQAAGLEPEDIEFIAYGAHSFEKMPTTSVLIQEELGIKACGEMSIHSNCTSAYKAIMLAHDLISLGRYKTVMVLSSQISSSQLIPEYFNPQKLKRTQMLIRWFLCDGAGCAIFSRDDSVTPKGSYLDASYIESVGCGLKPFMFNNMESYSISPKEAYENGMHHITQEGVLTQKGEDNVGMLAKIFTEGLQRMAGKFDIDLSKTTHFQVNFPARHIFELIKERCGGIGIPENSYYEKLYKFGYPGPPAALIALDNIVREEEIKPGDQVISFVTEVSKVMQGGYMVKGY